MTPYDAAPPRDEPEPGEEADPRVQVQPINWNLLTAEEAQPEWLDLNDWVDWLRRTYGLPPTVVPPFWHRHDELIWELSALHLHWLACFDAEASASMPLTWHRDFAEARNRLREWVATSGTRLDHDRPTRQATWPGEPLPSAAEERVIENRAEDFVQFVNDDLEARRRIEDRVLGAAETRAASR
ncbi:MAG: hypothetical protein QM572_01165 [Nocardioides sp.]|uniref:hypothetical protein n=1 Tax=Nocardioides sp. TaxID=35761 RepID=UPI0039E3750E